MKNFKVKLRVILNNYSDRNVEIKISEEDFIGGHNTKRF